MNDDDSGRRALGELATMRHGSGREPLPVWVLWTVAAGLAILSAGALGIGILAMTTRGDVKQNTGAIAVADSKARTVARRATVIATEAARVARNLRRTQRCLTVSTRTQRCLDRVAGVRGPGGAAGAAGAMGQRGLAAVARRGPRGRDAPSPTPAQLAAGFAIHCSPMLCVGEDAPPVTQAELIEALEVLCGGSCVGEDAPPPTQDQVNAAVLAALPAICAAGGCPAPPGPPGPQGPQGPAAPCDPSLGYVCQPTPDTATTPAP